MAAEVEPRHSCESAGHDLLEFARLAVVEQPVGQEARAIEDFQANVVEVSLEHALDQVIHAVGAVDPSDQGGPALFLRQWQALVGVNRVIGQDARLHIGLRFLHQFDLPGVGDRAGVAGPFHRGAALWLGEHVVAEGAQISSAERFQEEDAAIALARAGRLDSISRKTFAMQALNVGVELLRTDLERKPDSLNALVGMVEIQLFDVASPPVARHGVRGGEQPGAAAQYLRIGKHMPFQLGANAPALQLKPLLQGVLVVPVEFPPDQAQGQE